MKIVKIVGFALLAYVLVVVAFESLIGVIQPSGDSTLVITPFEPDGASRRPVPSVKRIRRCRASSH